MKTLECAGARACVDGRSFCRARSDADTAHAHVWTDGSTAVFGLRVATQDFDTAHAHAQGWTEGLHFHARAHLPRITAQGIAVFVCT